MSDETQVGPGWGELEAMLPLGTHSIPPGLQQLQFVWRGSRSLSAQQEIFTHVLDQFSYCS